MNELSRHIEILLLDNDCVIVPGFGGFVAHHIPAEYVSEDELFYPPQRTLGFNVQLQLNDSLLVQSYVEAYDISYPEAVKRIEKEVEEIKQIINQEGLYEFHGIGIVSKTMTDRYNFEPCAAGLPTPSLFALNSYSFGEVEQEEEAAEQVLQVETAPIAISTAEEKEEEPEMALEEETDGTIHIRLKTLRNVLAAAMVLLLFTFVSLPLGKGSSNALQCSVVDPSLISMLMKLDASALMTGAQKDVNAADSTKALTVEKKTAEEKTEKKVAEESYYTIVLASKVSRSGAEALVDKLKKKGLTEAAIYEHNTMRKVLYGKYTTKADADKAMSKLCEKEKTFEGVWVQEMN